MRLTIAARRSDLARIQARMVAGALLAKFPGLEIEFHFRESLGDQNQSQPLWQMPEKGVFTEDLRGELIAGRTDLVVHSWKDLPIENGPETAVVATLPRADARDLLLVREDRWPAIAASGTIRLLTSSPRRIRNLALFLAEALPGDISKIEFLAVRGNMQTRIGKMWQKDESGATPDGLILAKAALDRLLEAEGEEFVETRTRLREALGQCRWMVLPLSANPGAAAQGALAIEIASNRGDLKQLLAEINCEATFAAVRREREILQSHGGGCHQAIGVDVLIRGYGKIEIVRGIDTGDRDVSRISLTSARPRPPRIEHRLLWPTGNEENRWFAREAIEVEFPAAGTALWVARADALPTNWDIGADRIVWTSGLRTWRRLARRGVWVNGSAEGLGENESPRIEMLAGRPLAWARLTHEESNGDDEMATLATYRLIPAGEQIDLAGRKYFFWTSGSNFKMALAANPWLREMTHFCGPGNTARALRNFGIEPHISLDHETWLEEMSFYGKPE